jgi:hypothetical protein
VRRVKMRIRQRKQQVWPGGEWTVGGRDCCYLANLFTDETDAEEDEADQSGTDAGYSRRRFGLYFSSRRNNNSLDTLQDEVTRAVNVIACTNTQTGDPSTH